MMTAAKPQTDGPQRPQDQIAHGMVKTTKLFKSPPGFANALAVAPEGLWIGPAETLRQQAAQ